MPAKRLRILSWNVNGIRSAARKGFLDWLAVERPDVLGLQETRIDHAALTEELRTPHGYHAAWSFPQRKGYSGVATFTRTPSLTRATSLGEPRFDDEGRMVEIELERLLVFNVYFPKGSGRDRDNSRVPYKLDFYEALFAHVLERRRASKKPAVVMGDFNTAHQPIDLTNARSNVTTSGFLPIEREAYAKHLSRGFVDTFRHLHPEKVQYSWWSQRYGVRERNVGWRIDAVWVTQDLVPHVKEAFILDQVRGSDHCPVGVTLGW